VLTGETGAGKSILLDSFALALGARGDSGLVRQGAEQGQVTAAFDVPKKSSGAGHSQGERHPGRRGSDPSPGAVRRRPHRAFLNDQPVAAQVLRSVGSALVEISRPA